MAEAQKLVLITGANKGIGYEVAKQLGQAGMQVLVGSRNVEAGRTALARLAGEGVQASLVHINLDDQSSITEAAAQVERDYGRLDMLVNNAAVVMQGDGPPGEAPLALVEQTMRTNFLGTLAVTQAFLPLLKRAQAAQIINVTSGLGSISLNADPEWEYAPMKLMGYNASKAALNMLTVHLAYELRDTPIRVNCVNPGYTATDMNGNSGHQTVAEGAAEIVRLATANGTARGQFLTDGGTLPW